MLKREMHAKTAPHLLELDLKALADADRQMLKKQIDQRVAARKHILKQLWVTPRIEAGQSRQA
jgi:hypothetical protein